MSATAATPRPSSYDVLREQYRLKDAAYRKAAAALKRVTALAVEFDSYGYRYHADRMRDAVNETRS